MVKKKKLRVAINGFGRIGRLVFRAIHKNFQDEMEVVAINDLAPPDNLAYLLKYDSTHGAFPGAVEIRDGALWVKGHEVRVCEEKDPAKLPWKEMNVDYVVESTGFFTQLEGAKKHLEAGAKRVVISAPAGGTPGQVPTFVMGVNNEDYNPGKDTVVSNASCTTNCLAPLVKVLQDKFGVVEALMTTVHAATASQTTVDGPSRKDWRGGRGTLQNIIPASTGAAKALALCMPELKGKITGASFRVPVADVSLVDLTVKLGKETSYEKICDAVKEAAEGKMKGILKYCDEPLVSSDFIGSTYSSVFDQDAGIALNSTFYKLVAWYDNEMGYSNRVADLLSYMWSKE